MKFKTNDTVYLKAKVIRVESGGFETGIGFHSNKYNLEILGAEEFITTDEAPIYTKQEMLKELQKPELPKVGEVWKHQGVDPVQIVFLSNDNIFFEYKDGFSTPGSFSIKVFLERFEKVGD